MEDTLTILIGAYGAILSTVILIWQIQKERKENQGKIEILMTLGYPILNGDQQELTLIFTLTNKGKQSRIINTSPYIEFDQPSSIGNSLKPFNDYYDEDFFPLTLDRGTYKNFYFDGIAINEQMQPIDMVGVNKFRGVIVDTIGQKYQTSWLSIKQLL